MEAKKLTLDTAVELREKLDREIHENYRIFVSNNSINKKHKDKYDLRELLRITELMEYQNIRLKEAIQIANLKSHPRERNSNSYYIFRLSQLKYRRDSFLRVSSRSGKVGKTEYVVEYTTNELNVMLRDIENEIDKISQKLSKFNTLRKNEIKVKIDHELLYLLNK